MSTPYSTPRHPGVPNPTPRSTGKAAALRPPIHNPYDKFTQPQFDAWINDITGALKRALGHDDTPPFPAQRVERPREEEESEDVEDSFAAVRARRLAKGKARATDADLDNEDMASQRRADDDGWGERLGGEEYGSSSEEEEEGSEEEGIPEKADAEVFVLSSDEDEDVEGEEQVQEDASDDEAIAGPSPVHDEEDGDSSELSLEEDVTAGEGAADNYADEEYAEEDISEGEAADHDEEVVFEGSQAGSDDVDEEPRSSPAPGPSTVHEVTEILDSDDEQEVHQAQVPERPAIPPRFQRKPNIVAPARIVPEEDEYDMLANEDEEQAEEEAEPFPPRAKDHEVVDIDDPWRGPSTYAEDFYSNGDIPTNALKHGNPHILPTEEGVDEIVEAPSPTPDIHDPWEGPRTYAEDFYSGGDVLPAAVAGLTPSHLTPHDDKLFIPGISAAPTETSSQIMGTAREAATADVDDFYANMHGSVQDAEHADADCAQHVSARGDADNARPPSPPSPTLTKHVDWNYPPAFRGRIATAPGHLEEDEFVEISDDEEDDFPSPTFASEPVQLSKVETEGNSDPTEEQVTFATTTSDIASGVMPTDFPLGFEELYDMGSTTPLMDVHDAFEPVASAIDFGDLPPSRGQNTPFDESSVGLPVEADIEREFIAAISESTDVPTRGVAEAPEAKHLQNPVEAMDVMNGEPSSREAQTPGFVVEFEDDVVQLLSTTGDIDVVSVSGDDATVPVTDYLVEEVLTERRRTEEPDALVVTEDGTADIVESFVDFAGAESSTQMGAAEMVGAERTDSTAEASQTRDLGSEQVTAEDAALVPVLAAEVNTEATGRPSDYPAPIAADPTVPDPTSVAHTPLSPASPTRPRADSEASSSGEAEARESLPVHAALLPVFRKLGSAHSASGLFTPLTDITSGSITPELVEAKSDDQLEGELQVEELDTANQAQQPSVVEEPAEEVGSEAAEEGAVDAVSEVSAAPVVEGTDVLNEGDNTGYAPTQPLGSDIPSVLEIHDETTEAEEVGRHETPATDVDVDADGEFDLDYVPSARDAAKDSSAVAEDKVVIAPPEDDDDPFRIKQSADAAPAQNAEQDQVANGSPLPAANSEVAASDTADDQVDAASAPDAEPELIASQENGTATAEIQDEVRPLKRKRKSPGVADRPVRLTRSRTAQSVNARAIAEPPVPKPRKGKGKQRARPEGADNDDAASVASSLASERSSGGSSTAAQRILIPGSRESSRASSVVSNVPSMYSQPSPTLMRTLVGNGDHFPPLPFIHDNGILRHNHGGRLTAVPIIPPPPPPKRQESQSSPDISATPRRASAEPAASQPPASRPTIAASTSSPVTRSNCRYHTISLPRGKTGRRIQFAVPGCAIGNAELMKEEDIEDHGFIDPQDLDNLITHVERLKISTYLLNVLRQLVGVDLIREQEVFYIPRPGDNVLRSKNASQRAKLAQRESISARSHSARDVSATSRAPPSQVSVSTSGGSASYTSKLSSRGSGSIRARRSVSDSDLSDLEEDGDMPPPKRPKAEAEETGSETKIKTEADELAPEDDGESSKAHEKSGENGNSGASTSIVRRRSRRSKLPVDMAEYKPDGGQSDGSDGHVEDASLKRKPGRKRGVKRTRTEENADAPTDDTGTPEKPKRRRVRAADKAPAAAVPEGQNGEAT